MMEYKFQITELLIRTFAGILFLFQGYDKLFKIKMPGVINAFAADTDKNHVPLSLLKLMAYYTSIVEFIGGVFLLCGFFTTFTLYALGLDLLLVCLAFSYMEALWDMKHVFPIFLLVMVLLLLPENYRIFCLDYILHFK
ncbi:MAG: DoxX family protein [Bacteroidetes bacterium]|nr:DoxX family protein [Bacteroidota bacterium]